MADGYNASHRGIGEMLTAPFMVADMRRRAELVKNAAQAIAPVGEGEYINRFEVDSGVQERKTRRAFGRVSNTDPKAFFLEVGTIDTPRFRVLGSALDAAKD